MNKYVDKENNFIEFFNPKNGFYMRSGIMKNENGVIVDSGIDPFMRNFPQLIDIGIMGSCVHGEKGLCIKGGVECYQNGLGYKQPNMTLEQFKSIVDECRGKTFQYALGGRGDVNKHDEFEDLLKYCVDNKIVPNYTTSGLDLTNKEVDITKKYCGAVAVSWYRQEHTFNAINKFIRVGMKTNIHYVLGKNTIKEAIQGLNEDSFPKGINAVIFLTHKPVGLGSYENVLEHSNPDLKEFFEIIDTKKFDFKIGFDSCTVPALINFTKNINEVTFDSCEGGRYSMYITPDMKAIPCSFDNQDLNWAYDISNDTIENAWKSPQFENFRDHFRNSCGSCKDKMLCYGGCPIRREIVVCNREEKDLYENKNRFCNK